MANQVPVTLTSRAGYRLVGILQTPDRVSSDLGVVLLAPGIKMRVGPQRLYKTLGDRMVQLGLPTLRFDFHGLGDSEGTLPEERLRDVYAHIQVGRFVEDTLDAVDWMIGTQGVKSVLLAGLCGGAVTGLLAGARDTRIAGLLSLGITPALDSQSADPSLYMTAGELSLMRRSYFDKLGRPAAWLRLLTLRSDYRLIWRSMSHGLRSLKRGARPAAAAPSPAADNANPLFPPAFFEMAATHRPMLMIFGGSDRLQWEFEEKFENRHRDRLSRLNGAYQVHVIPRANHTLTLRAWQDEMLDISAHWLKRNFPSAIFAD